MRRVMSPLERCRAVRWALACAFLVGSPRVAFGQADRSPVVSAAVGFGLHNGEFGGRTVNGLAASAIGWRRLGTIVALRADFSWTYNVNAHIEVVCIWDPCPSETPSQVPAIGISAMLGDLATKARRVYVVAGAEMLFTSGGPQSEDGAVSVPKLGLGLLSSSDLFVEFSGRWRGEWGGWRLRHFVILAGWYR